MSAPTDPAPRSPEAVARAADSILGYLVQRWLLGSQEVTMADVMEACGYHEAFTFQMALDALARGGRVYVLPGWPGAVAALGPVTRRAFGA